MKSVDQARNLAQDIVARAIAAGADAADAAAASHASLNVSVRLGALEDVGRSEGEDLSLRVFVGKRNASVSTSEFAGAALDELVDRAIRMAKEAPEDKWAGLAPKERLLHGAPPMLDVDDGGVISPEELRERALAAEDAARAIDGVTNSEGAGAGASRSVIALATSHGFAGGYATTSYGIQASVLAGKAGGMERDYAHHSARHLAHLEDAATIGRCAGERAVKRLNPGRVSSGAMPVVFDPRVGASLLGHLVSAIAGPAIARKTSFLLDAMGDRVFAPGVTVRDDPHRPHGLRSRPFDGEGLASRKNVVVEKGILKTYLCDSYAARKLGRESTASASRSSGGGVGGGTTNFVLQAGTDTNESIVKGTKRGLYVTEMMGFGFNAVTGDFSRGASGFWIENGEIAFPVSEVTISLNVDELWKRLDALGSDIDMRTSIVAPTIRIGKMTIAGGG